MKTLLLSLFITATALLFGQESKTVQVVMSKDSLYRFEEKTYFEGDSTLLTNARYYPERWLNVEELKGYLYAAANQQDERKRELLRLRTEAVNNFNFYISLLDTIVGAGTYANLQKQELYNALNGAWSLIERNGGSPVIKAVTIQAKTEGNATATWNGKTSLVQADDKITFNLLSGGIFNFNLKFTYKPGNGTFVAERGTKKYILRR